MQKVFQRNDGMHQCEPMPPNADVGLPAAGLHMSASGAPAKRSPKVFAAQRCALQRVPPFARWQLCHQAKVDADPRVQISAMHMYVEKTVVLNV